MTAKLMEAASALLWVPKSGSTAVMLRGLWSPSRGHATSILQLLHAVHSGHVSFYSGCSSLKDWRVSQPQVHYLTVSLPWSRLVRLSYYLTQSKQLGN